MSAVVGETLLAVKIRKFYTASDFLSWKINRIRERTASFSYVANYCHFASFAWIWQPVSQHRAILSSASKPKYMFYSVHQNPSMLKINLWRPYCPSYSAGFIRIVPIKYLLRTSTPDMNFLMYLENDMKLFTFLPTCYSANLWTGRTSCIRVNVATA